MRQLLVVLLSLLINGCATQPDRWVELRGQRFHVEVRDDEPGRQQGLMYRSSLPADQGMLFLFDRPQPLAFWMKNTLIPLDILYFDADRKLVSVAQRVPPCKSASCPNYPSRHPAQFVLELNAGRAQALGVSIGDELVFGPEISGKGEP